MLATEFRTPAPDDEERIDQVMRSEGGLPNGRDARFLPGENAEVGASESPLVSGSTRR